MTADNGKAMPPLEIPAHGSGRIYRGGVPGNKGGGRPPSVLREAMRAALDERLPILSAIADDEEARPVDRLRAIDILCKYGIGQRHELGNEIDAPHAPDLNELRAAITRALPRVASTE